MNKSLKVSIYCLEIAIAIALIVYFQLNPNRISKPMTFSMSLLILALIFQIYLLRKKK